MKNKLHAEGVHNLEHSPNKGGNGYHNKMDITTNRLGCGRKCDINGINSKEISCGIMD
jgi:hypothetical protein